MGSIRDFLSKNQDTIGAVAGTVGTLLPIVGEGLKKYGDVQSMNATKKNQSDIDADLAKSQSMVGKQAELRPELSESIAEARRLYQEGRLRAERGFDATQEAAYMGNLQSQINADRTAAMEMGGGQAGNSIAAVLNNRKATSLLDYASRDAAQKLNNQQALNPLYDNMQQNATVAQNQQNLYDQALAKTISDLKLNKYMLREDIAQKRSSNFGKYATEMQQKQKQIGDIVMKFIPGGGGSLGGGGNGGIDPSLAPNAEAQYLKDYLGQ